ncbi:MAG TPA: hypothetical protein VFA41_03555 [Ktedonobacteraceae bacterium]|jgi:hypothetical protein|nr:hypothetical protein [Ktedonobacteraceae bacterium]
MHRLKWIVFITISLCMLFGLFAGIFAHSIEAALTLGMDANMPKTTPVTASPTPSGSGKTPATPTPLPTGVMMLAHDTFQRKPQILWGTASDGRQWMGDANSIEVFSITNNAGQIANGQGTFNAILGPTITNAEVLFTASMNHFHQDKANFGAVLRWTDPKNWYKALLDGKQLQILRSVNGVIKPLGSVPFKPKDGAMYTIRFRALGATLSLKAWQSGQPEPANWMLTVTDPSLTSGFGGIRVLMLNDSMVQVTSFLETTLGTMA